MRMTRGASVSSSTTATCVTPRRISTALQQQFHGCLVPARCCTHQSGHAAAPVRLTLLPQVARSWQKCSEPGFIPEKRQCKQFGCSAIIRHVADSLAARKARRWLCRLLARLDVSQRGINSKWLTWRLPHGVARQPCRLRGGGGGRQLLEPGYGATLLSTINLTVLGSSSNLVEGHLLPYGSGWTSTRPVLATSAWRWHRNGAPHCRRIGGQEVLWVYTAQPDGPVFLRFRESVIWPQVR
jgi:hypothetical protein